METIGGIVVGIYAIERFGRVAKPVSGCEVPVQAVVLSLIS
ncbi:MAG: hypothetical protein P0111_00820 [Nitrospira sp.]|nr:hypothetical protein [Nitrospira sp.]